MAKISHAPANLRAQVALIAQGQNRVSVCLRDGVAVASALQQTFTVSFNQALISVSMMPLKPGQQRRSEIKTYVRVVIEESLAAVFRLAHADKSIGAVALEMNALIPVMERRGAWFRINNSRPGILARRLIEMTVDD